jgi:hypothetical protein
MLRHFATKLNPHVCRELCVHNFFDHACMIIVIIGTQLFVQELGLLDVREKHNKLLHIAYLFVHIFQYVIFYFAI